MQNGFSLLVIRIPTVPKGGSHQKRCDPPFAVRSFSRAKTGYFHVRKWFATVSRNPGSGWGV